MEYKSTLLEVKDLSTESRTAILAHAVYGNIDVMGDISTKGMFKSSWERKSGIDFLFNHDNGAIVGNVKRTFEDDSKAYTEVKFGNWKLGDDVMSMIDAGVIRGVSFGFITEKKDFVNKDGRKIRVLRQVDHTETSILTKPPANPLTHVVSMTKQADVINEWKAQIERMEAFCSRSNATDSILQDMEAEIKQAKLILSSYDTVSTPLITDGEASRDEVKEFAQQLELLTLTL